MLFKGDAVKQYVNPAEWLIAFILINIAAVPLGIWLIFTLKRGRLAFFVGIGMLELIVCLAFQISKTRRFYKRLKKLKQNGKYDDIEADFQYAKPLFQDQIRLGRKYLFTNGTGHMIDYGDIIEVYERKRNNSAITSLYADVAGEDWPIMLVNPIQEKEMGVLMDTLKSRNPFIFDKKKAFSAEKGDSRQRVGE